MSEVINIEGIQEAQAANEKAIAALQPRGAFAQAIKHVVVGAHKYAVDITHVDTGALRAAHRMKIDDGGQRGVIYIDPRAHGPQGDPSIYGPHEAARGGEHDFYGRTVKEAIPTLRQQALRTLVRAVVYGG